MNWCVQFDDYKWNTIFHRILWESLLTILLADD